MSSARRSATACATARVELIDAAVRRRATTSTTCSSCGPTHRDALRAHLDERGIASAVHYPVPIHRTEALRAPRAGRRHRGPSPSALAERICSLPLWPGMTDAQVERVVEAVREFAPPSAGVGRFARSSQALGAPARTSSESTAMTA